MSYMKRELYFNIGAFIMGVIFLIVSLLFYDNSTLFGGGVAFTIVGLLGVIYHLKLMKTPDKYKEIELAQNEERTVFIREKTNSKVYSIFIYIESAGCLIAGILRYRDVTIALAFILLAKIIVWFIIGTKIAKEN
ncbi:hypothetical protein [Clostridium lundense]|uniref:hypothetical protein n=1 Tax=Clostridium lundense TaxID=319475 RepID=UPI000684251C|nr:hypothetical protein [Clostridium lundense]